MASAPNRQPRHRPFEPTQRGVGPVVWLIVLVVAAAAVWWYS
jgi:hypothetical protein